MNAKAAIDTRTGKMWLGSDGILRANTSKEVQTLADAKENLEVARKLSGGVRRPLIVTIASSSSLSAEARAHYTSPESVDIITSLAIVTSSMLGRVIGNIMVGMTSNALPIALFATERDALAWIGNHWRQVA